MRCLRDNHHDENMQGPCSAGQCQWPECSSNERIKEITMSNEQQKIYSYSTDEENFYGRFNTIEDALIAGSSKHDGPTVFVGELTPVKTSEFVDAKQIIEEVSLKAGEQCGESVDFWPDLSEEEISQLEKLICDFIDSCDEPEFMKVINVEEFGPF